MAGFKLLLFLSLVTLEIACFSSSFTVNAEASSSSGCDELKSTVSSLQSIITEKNQKLVSKDEKIRGLELYIREKSYLFESETDFSSQSEDAVKHASKAEEKVYELQKQVYALKREVEMQRKRRLEVEAEKVSQPRSKLENMDGKWFLSRLGLNPNITQAYLLTLWHQHLSPTLHITLQKVSQIIDQVQKWSESHIETLNSKWIPSIKDACVTFTIYLEPKVQYLTDKSIEVLCTSKQALTPHLIQGFDASYYYLEVIRTHTHPYTTRIMTITKPHLERVQLALEPYTENVRHGFKKLVNSTKIYHRQAQEMLKNNEVTKPVATMDLAWVGATALIGFPLIFIIKLLSAVSNPKGKKRYSHRKEPVVGYRRAKRRHPHQ
ncbi:PREDICTED: golgin subfamily A member 4-like [Camelina sativa]|uniref:Golgin subfamily A member 4-like n=1 Tax=Camelina sativa TaxID=90675 RepID=A0ABM0UA97_CAMSA|nr:PREDICTED: golgin subfamily A member 4-like [Camelina sativa]